MFFGDAKMRIAVFSILMTLCLGVSAVLAQQDDVVVTEANRDNSFVVQCEDGRQLVGGVKITFLDVSPGFSYQVTAMGVQDFDPAIAVVTEPGIGECNNNNPEVVGSQVAVPGIGFAEAQATAAQFLARAPRDPSENLEILIGGYAGSSGRFAAVIENFGVNPAEELDRFLMQVPTSSAREPLGVFMIGQTDNINPYMQVVDNLEQYIDPFDVETVTISAICDDVTVEPCDDTPSMDGGGVILENSETYVADNLDAGIIRAPNTNQPMLYSFGASQQDSTGDYAIVVTGTAPGHPTDPRFICDNVAASIERVSSSYSSAYGPENLLDGDPTTGWATTVVSQATATEEEQQTIEEFIVVRLDGRRLVDRVRVNGYSPSENFEDNSLRGFSVAVQNINGDQVTVFSGNAPRQPGFRDYRFLPIEIEAVGFVFESNHGGNFLEVADIQVCAVS